MKKLHLLWCDVKRFFARYHPQTKEQVIDGNRKYWDEYYRQWRPVETVKPQDERMTLFPPGQMPPEIEK